MTTETEAKVLARLEVQIENLTREFAGLRAMMLEQKAPIDLRVDRHERQTKEQFSEIKEALKELSGDVKGMRGELEERSKPNYGPIIAGIALAWSISSAIGGFFINSQNATITRIERDIIAVRESTIPRTEFEGFSRRLEAIEKRPR